MLVRQRQYVLAALARSGDEHRAGSENPAAGGVVDDG
jgi:hypothetical protein